MIPVRRSMGTPGSAMTFRSSSEDSNTLATWWSSASTRSRSPSARAISNSPVA